MIWVEKNLTNVSIIVSELLIFFSIFFSQDISLFVKRKLLVKLFRRLNQFFHGKNWEVVSYLPEVISS